MVLLQEVGVKDQGVLREVKEHKDKMRYHIACNRVFEYAHQKEMKRAKEEGLGELAQQETIVHPNDYFKRSYLLKNLDAAKEEKAEKGGDQDVQMVE